MQEGSAHTAVPNMECTLYADILRYQQRAADMVATLGPAPTGLEVGSELGLPPYEIGVVDALVRQPLLLGSLPAMSYIEYQIALTRRSDGKTATIGKRYSELLHFNTELHRRDIVRKIDAPTFPEKKVFCDDWWRLQTVEPDSKFVKERREEIHYYLKKLFIANPNLCYDEFVQEFFVLDTFDQRADEEAYLKKTSGNLAQGPEPSPTSVEYRPVLANPYHNNTSPPPHPNRPNSTSSSHTETHTNNPVYPNTAHPAQTKGEHTMSSPSRYEYASQPVHNDSTYAPSHTYAQPASYTASYGFTNGYQYAQAQQMDCDMNGGSPCGSQQYRSNGLVDV